MKKGNLRPTWTPLLTNDKISRTRRHSDLNYQKTHKLPDKTPPFTSSSLPRLSPRLYRPFSLSLFLSRARGGGEERKSKKRQRVALKPQSPGQEARRGRIAAKGRRRSRPRARTRAKGGEREQGGTEREKKKRKKRTGRKIPVRLEASAQLHSLQTPPAPIFRSFRPADAFLRLSRHSHLIQGQISTSTHNTRAEKVGFTCLN